MGGDILLSHKYIYDLVLDLFKLYINYKDKQEKQVDKPKLKAKI